jgi:hypothetical protein
VPTQQARPTPVQSFVDSPETHVASPADIHGRVPIPQAIASPCALVSQAEMSGIAGAAVTAKSQAPLGPTCVFRLGSSSAITVALERLSFAGATRQLHQPQKVTVAGRASVCGNLGRPMLYAPVAQQLVLQVVAPCAVAQRVAAIAIARLKA